MSNRRDFLGKFGTGLAGLLIADNTKGITKTVIHGDFPVVISTWIHGVKANDAAWEILQRGGYALDAAEAAARITEADPEVITVGYGGLPDANGKVTLDACIMDEKGNAGSVAFLEHIKHPISVARLVMEKTPHVMLTGKGALAFALENGYRKENLLTAMAKASWKKWRKEDRTFKPVINIENEILPNHDTIGILALDAKGRICGACTTSGMAYKLHGRVGDSPIIGAGLFVDGEVGGAVATGSGELVMKTLGSFLVVELMRNGMSPNEACREAVKRIAKKIEGFEQHQIGYLALDKQGNVGSFSMQSGFEYAIRTERTSDLVKVQSLLG